MIRILGIEDNNEDALLLSIHLKKLSGIDARFTHCKRLSEALEKLEKEFFDLIFLDLTLPDSSGTETLKNLTLKNEHIPVVVLTGIKDDKLIDEILQTGAQDYLIKGYYDTDILQKTIRYAIERQKLINELKLTNYRLNQLSIIDPMTGIFNRRGLQNILSDKITNLVKRANIYAALIDIDDFKKINDDFGHSTGDIVLCEVASTLNTNLRATDYLSRIGGDEFIAIITDINQAEVLKLAEKLRSSLSGVRFITHDKHLNITCSIGLIQLKKDFISIDDILANVKLSLKTSKLHGKNQVSLIENNTVITISKNEIYQSLAEAIKSRKNIFQEYMPVCDIEKNEMIAAEFLTRSMIPGMEMPFNLFQQAFEANMLSSLDTACFELAIGNAQKVDTKKLFINIYPTTILSTPLEYFQEHIGRLAKGTRVCFEISEQQIIGNPKYILEAVSNLKRIGIDFAIDDIGFGQTCLENLIILSPEIAKVDRTCVTGISGKPHLQRNLSRIVNILNSLKIDIVAEGIETTGDLKVVQDLGIRYGQGFLWGKPKEII